MGIDSCICCDISFFEILELKENSLEILQEKHDICNRCRLCNPYVKVSLETGQIKFNEIL